MGFVVLARGNKGKNSDIVSVRSLDTYQQFTIGASLVKTLGWEAGKKINIAVGTDEDKGKLLILLTEEGMYGLSKFSAHSDTLRFLRAKVPGFPLEAFGSTTMKHRVQGSNLYLDIPEKFEPVVHNKLYGREAEAAKPWGEQLKEEPITARLSPALTQTPVRKIELHVDSREVPNAPGTGLYQRRCQSHNCNKVFKTDSIKRVVCYECAR